MESPELARSEYWESDEVDLRLNPKRSDGTDGLVEFFTKELGIEGAVVMATSGTAGRIKFVVLSKAAMLASADAVVAHCGIGQDDVSLAGLSDFHVGGLGIYARAFRSESRVVALPWDQWERDGRRFVDTIRANGVTLTSMTPTHLHDLVSHEVAAPESLRGVFLGGGAIDADLVGRASALGWPVWASYGMTEAASQIATSLGDSVEWLPILPHWETDLDSSGRLRIRGLALFSGYVTGRVGKWEFEPAADAEGWFTTNDTCEIRGGRLRFLKRSDNVVKVSGELVSLSQWQDRLDRSRIDGIVVAVPHARLGNELVAVLVGAEGEQAELERLNDGLPAIDQVRRIERLESLPRTDLGKIDAVEVVKQVSPRS